MADSGAPDAASAAVGCGKVQAGALNISVWDKFVADRKVDTTKVRAFYTTPPYFDYNWTVHADMPAATREKLTQALLSLSKDTPEGKEILELQRASKFVPTKADNYKGIEAAARSIGPSGAGKTTLLQVLACALPPTGGTLALGGQNPWKLPRPELQRLRGQLFLAPQVPPLPPR